jgi:hypothetical protein
MKPLTIELTKGDSRQLQSVGWKTPKGNECRRHFFALDQDGKPLVVTPKPAMPRFFVPGSSAVISREPFPEAVCVEISPCRLLAPPCYQTREEFESQLPGHYCFEPWRAIYWETHRQVLILEPADTAPLKERLDKWLAAMRAAYEQEAALWRDRIQWVTTATLQELGFDNEEQRANRLRELQAQLDMVESENPIEGMPCKGRLKWTLEDIKRGHEGIRDAWKHEDWANKNGEDLGVMARERRAFRRWLETHTGTPANIIDTTRRVPDPNDPSKSRPTAYPGISPPSFGERFEDNPQFLEACAQVRYRARFADNAGSVVYLENCEIREEPTAEERNEVAQLTKTAPAPEPIPWHTEGFATIRRCNDKGEMIETLPLANEFRALCQLLAERPDQTAQYSEIEPQIGTRAHDLDIAAGVINPAQKGERRVRDLLRTETGRRLLEWGVLTEIEVGREKFLKLCPPAPPK